MRARHALGVLAVLLAGCGGAASDNPTVEAPPKASSTPQGKAVAAWADAVDVHWREFGSCGSRAEPVRGFYSSCTKATRRAYRRAAAKAGRALRPCASAGRRVQALIARVGGSVDRAVNAFDRSNDASLEHRPYRGPPVQALYLKGARAVEEDVPRARTAGQAIRGC